MSLRSKGRGALFRLSRPWVNRRRRRFYAAFISRGDLCFDVGAHTGTKLELFLALGARVIAIEPDTACADSLRRKYGNRRDVVIVEHGLSSDGRALPFWLNSKYPELSSYSPLYIDECRDFLEGSGGQWQRGVPGQTLTLDDLISQYGLPDFCKIDVEGFEDEVLSGLSQAIQHICFERLSFFPAPALNSIDKLSKLGNYRFNYAYNEESGLALETWYNSGQMLDLLQEFNDFGPVGCDIHARLS